MAITQQWSVQALLSKLRVGDRSEVSWARAWDCTETC